MDAVEEIKQRLAIEDVIGEYVELKRAGRNFKGLSPFGAEKTPSFMVSPEKQIWHDFSSGKGGNMFSFVMEMEGLDFKGALELLARKSGVDLAQYRNKNYASNTKLKERLHEVLELAAKYYQVQLKDNKDALEYILKERALDKETVIEFKMGYAPEGGQALSQFLLKKGFIAEELKKAGLGNIFSGNLKDMFRGRITIALTDAQGRVIGFTARQLANDSNTAKYINTSQTLLYDKSRHIFGLHLAKDTIRRLNYVVVVEGNMDVIASRQAGVKNVVATAGTAMTMQHLKEISRFTNDIRLCFDADKAGQNATERTIILTLGVDVKLSIINIPSGKDPDELIKTDKQMWNKIVQDSVYSIDWLIEYYAEGVDLTTGLGKKTYSKKITPVLKNLKDPVEQEHYQKLIAQKLGVSYLALSKQFDETSKKTYKKQKSPTVINKYSADIAKTENQYLSLMLEQPSLRHYMEVANVEMMHSTNTSEMFLFIKEHTQEKSADLMDKLKDVQNLNEYGKVTSLLYEELYANLEFIELQYEAARLQVRVIENYVKEQKQTITEQLKIELNDSQVNELLQKAKKLDILLKSAKETISGK